jgi:transposase-like protein
MLNYKCKSHRGRSPANKTDAICIVEINETSDAIDRVWAEVIPNKQSSTLIPIINDHVQEFSTVHTDELKSYLALRKLNYNHLTVCHKYAFVDTISNVHTQSVESFNNELKYQIKLRKGIKTGLRNDFLTEFLWIWNNKCDLLNNLINLIKK